MTMRARNAAGELLEPAFQAQVVGLLRVYNWALIYHAPDGGHAPAAAGRRRVAGGQLPEGRGFPDLVALKGPRLLVAELKTDKGRVGPGQAAWLDAFREVGAAVSVTLEACRSYAELLGDRTVRSDGLSAAPSVEAYLWRPRDWHDLHDIIRAGEPRRRDLDPL